MSGKGRVLVVDDDEAIREFINLALASEGYEVVEAPDGAVALDLVGKVRPDLILLDMRMPVMDGWQFASAYRALPAPYAPIVVITAVQDHKNPAAEIGAAGLLRKPFELDELIETVDRNTGR